MSENEHSAIVERLFHETLACEPAGRAEFLAAACGGDVAVMADVASLLTSYENEKNPLERPAFHLSALQMAHRVFDQELLDGPWIAGYTLIREIGRGGMGAVYEGSRPDSNLHERFAVKLVKREIATDFIIRRFEHERRILANLEHPYIARLLDGGTTDDGLPYLVMEYVEGQPIDEYVAEAGLPTLGRLEVFLDVCDAVSYAHSHGVIHRDLKPSNILVTREGTPKLLDFGIAKLVNLEFEGKAVDHTATIHRVMTPRYASPEQLSGRALTEASDVYSLGVLLYVLLTGEHPYQFSEHRPEAILRSIDRQRIRKPSDAVTHSIAPGRDTEEVTRELKGNLDRIVLKALRREPDRRYESIEEFANDIRLHIAGRKITAKRDSVAYRSKQFLRQHRAYVLPTAMIGALCLLLGVLMGLSGARTKPKTSIAVMPFSGGAEGSYSEQLANGLANGLSERLSSLPQLAVLSQNSVLSYKRRRLDPKTVAQSLGVETVMTGSLTVDEERLSIQIQLIADNGNTMSANTYTVRPSELLSVQRRIIADVTQKLGVTPSAAQLSESLRQQTNDEEAYQLYLRGRYFFNRRLTEDFYKGIEYFRRATERDPQYALAYAGIADCYGLLGAYMTLSPAEAFKPAREAAMKAIEIDETLAEAHNSLALVHWLYDWDWAAADREFRRAIELKPSYVTAHHWRALFLGEMSRFEEAEAEIKLALMLDPVSPPVLADYGRVLFWQRRYDEAVEKYRMVAEMGNIFGAWHVEAHLCYEQAGLTSEWAVLRELLGDTFDTEEREALRARGLHGYWMVKYRRQEWQSNWDAAEICARVGDKQKALRFIAEAIKERDHHVTQLKVDPIFDLLRSDPRLEELLRRVNLTP
jgi:serine/threonine protein kinase/tetratricopeptide (TPR) repeat protein